MALAVGLMLSAVFDLFSSAHEEAVDMYGDIGANIPLLTGGLVSTITLVCVEKFCFAHIPDGAFRHCMWVVSYVLTDDDVDHAVVSHAGSQSASCHASHPPLPASPFLLQYSNSVAASTQYPPPPSCSAPSSARGTSPPALLPPSTRSYTQSHREVGGEVPFSATR